MFYGTIDILYFKKAFYRIKWKYNNIFWHCCSNTLVKWQITTMFWIWGKSKFWISFLTTIPHVHVFAVPHPHIDQCNYQNNWKTEQQTIIASPIHIRFFLYLALPSFVCNFIQNMWHVFVYFSLKRRTLMCALSRAKSLCMLCSYHSLSFPNRRTLLKKLLIHKPRLKRFVEKPHILYVHFNEIERERHSIDRRVWLCVRFREIISVLRVPSIRSDL